MGNRLLFFKSNEVLNNNTSFLSSVEQEKAGKLVSDEEDATLISSLTDDFVHHKPVLDFDFPCELKPSATPGHFHLYIEKDLTRPQMDALIEGLHKAGLIQFGVYEAYKQKGMTQVRTQKAIESKKKHLARKVKETYASAGDLDFNLAGQLFSLMFSQTEVSHPVTGKVTSLQAIVMSLNDTHKWTYEQIADWLETLDADISIKDADGKEVII